MVNFHLPITCIRNAWKFLEPFLIEVIEAISLLHKTLPLVLLQLSFPVCFCEAQALRPQCHFNSKQWTQYWALLELTDEVVALYIQFMWSVHVHRVSHCAHQVTTGRYGQISQRSYRSYHFICKYRCFHSGGEAQRG